MATALEQASHWRWNWEPRLYYIYIYIYTRHSIYPVHFLFQCGLLFFASSRWILKINALVQLRSWRIRSASAVKERKREGPMCFWDRKGRERRLRRCRVQDRAKLAQENAEERQAQLQRMRSSQCERLCVFLFACLSLCECIVTDRKTDRHV